MAIEFILDVQPERVAKSICELSEGVHRVNLNTRFRSNISYDVYISGDSITVHNGLSQTLVAYDSQTGFVSDFHDLQKIPAYYMFIAHVKSVNSQLLSNMHVNGHHVGTLCNDTLERQVNDIIRYVRSSMDIRNPQINIKSKRQAEISISLEHGILNATTRNETCAFHDAGDLKGWLTENLGDGLKW